MPVAEKRKVAEHKLTKGHRDHGKHLCSMVANREMDKVADLAENAKFICNICGRAAASQDNLCEPVEI